MSGILTLKEMRRRLRNYGGKVSGNYREVLARLTRFENSRQEDRDYPYGKRPKVNVLPSDGNETFNEDCCICLEKNTSGESIKTKCHHGFHEKCINEWLKNDSRCPICRSQIGRNVRQQRISESYIQTMESTTENNNNNNEDGFVSESILQQHERPHANVEEIGRGFELRRSDTSMRELMGSMRNTIIQSLLTRQSYLLQKIQEAQRANNQNELLIYSLDLSDVTRQLRSHMNQ